MIVTFSDAVFYCLNYLAKDAKESPQAKRIVIDAYRSIPNKRDWNYYKRLLRVNTVAAQSTGTIEYVESTRTMTLTGATWPSWATGGSIRIGQTMYYIESIPTSTTIILNSETTPGDDLDAGTSYVLSKDTYTLPSDFRSLLGINWQSGTYNPAYVDYEQFISLSTLVTGPAAPTYYTIFGDRLAMGRKALLFYPAPDLAYPVNAFYNGAGRPLSIEYYRAGTVSSTAASRTITGSGTAWTSAMIGSVIRFAQTAARDTAGNLIYPTGTDGLYPAAMEYIITAVASATSLTVDAAAELTLTATAYEISDPIDVNEGAMMNLFYRSIDLQARLSMRSKDIGPSESAAYNTALMEAFEADSVFGGTRVALANMSRPRLMREYPISLSG
jgi:hypothetical protein